MFFTQDVLVTSGGKFATIWLAAIKKNSVKRRDYERVDLDKTCRDLQKHFKPSMSGRMATIKGFSLRLSAQLVYGISVVYNMKVVYLYKECTLSLQSLHRYNSQLHLCPTDLEISKQPPASIQDAAPETMRNPMYGHLYSLPVPDEFGPEFLTQPSSSNLSGSAPTSDGVPQGVDAHAVHDLSTITMSEPVPIFLPPAELEIFDVGEANAQDMQNMMDDNFFTNVGEPILPPVFPTAAQNITTPASALLCEPPAPSRPSKTSQRQRKRKDDDSDLAAELPQDQANAEVPNVMGALVDDMAVVEKSESVISDELRPQRQKSDEDAAHAGTMELVLDPLPEIGGDKRSSGRVPAQIVDRQIELSSELIRNQLRTRYDTIETYAEEGNLLEPSNLPTAKDLFETSSCGFEANAPSRHEPFRNAKKLTRYNKASIPQSLFEESVKGVSSSGTRASRVKTFSAHHVAAEESPQPQREHVDIPPATSFDQAAARSREQTRDDTLMTEGSSIQGFRDISRISMGPVRDEIDVRGVRASMDFEGLSRGLEESHSHLGFLNDVEIQQMMGEPQDLMDRTSSEQLEPVQMISSCDALFELIQTMALQSDGTVSFSSLAPTRATSRLEASQRFFSLLMLAKLDKISLYQEGDYGEIFIQLRFI